MLQYWVVEREFHFTQFLRMPGKLYLVATPIGNLEDITIRAVRILAEVNLIAAEDTRRTATLLRHYAIKTGTISLHQHNEKERAPKLVRRLLNGESIALLSDAGTPLISDPGFEMVRQALDARIPIVALPGPSAVVAALVSSGAPTNSFTFLGFPPKRANDRKKWCAALTTEDRTLVFFESPHRLATTLKMLADNMGDRTISICRELTKIHEELVVGPILGLSQNLRQPRGEYTCVVWPPGKEIDFAIPRPNREKLLKEMGLLLDKMPSRRAAVRIMASKYRISSSIMYQEIEEAKNKSNDKTQGSSGVSQHQQEIYDQPKKT